MSDLGAQECRLVLGGVIADDVIRNDELENIYEAGLDGRQNLCMFVGTVGNRSHLDSRFRRQLVCHDQRTR